MTDTEVASRRQAIVDRAVAQECELAGLFIDEIETAPSALDEALGAVLECDVRVLIVPSLFRFAGSGDPFETRRHLAGLGVQVLLSEGP